MTAIMQHQWQLMTAILPAINDLNDGVKTLMTRNQWHSTVCLILTMMFVRGTPGDNPANCGTRFWFDHWLDIKVPTNDWHLSKLMISKQRLLSLSGIVCSHGFYLFLTRKNPDRDRTWSLELTAYSVVGLNCEEKLSILTNWQERKTWLIGNIMPQKTERQSLMKRDTRNPRARPVLHQFSSHRQFLALAPSPALSAWPLSGLDSEELKFRMPELAPAWCMSQPGSLPSAPCLTWSLWSVTSIAASILRIPYPRIKTWHSALCYNVICALHKHL